MIRSTFPLACGFASRSPVFLLAAFILATCCGNALAKPPADLDARIEKIVGRHVNNDGPGAAILVAQEGKVVHRGGYGLADLEKEVPINSRTALDLASVAKQFTAMAIMILAQRGKLDYTDDVADLLPSYEVPTIGRPVRVQDLLWHTSGLADYTGAGWSGSDEEFRDLTTAAHLKWLNGTSLRRAPGIKYEYNNSGYCLLGQVVQRLSKKSYAEFLKAEIFDPLDMRDTVVMDNLETRVPRVATGYKVNKAGKATRSHSPSVINGDGNIFCTIDDLAKWDAALREHKLVKAAALKRAFTPGQLDNGKEVPYGFGWLIARDNGSLWVGHVGGWAGTATYISRYIDDELTVVVLSNNENAPVSDIGDEIAALFDE